MGGGRITVNSVTAADSFLTISGAASTIAAGSTNYRDGYGESGESRGRFSSEQHSGEHLRGLGQLTGDAADRKEPHYDPEPRRNPVSAEGRFFARQPQRIFSGSRFRKLFGELERRTASGGRLADIEYFERNSTSSSPGAVSFAVDPAVAATLASQPYYAAIQVTSGSVVDSPQTFVVVLNVAPAASPVQPDPTPPALLFLSGATGAPAPQIVQLFASSSAAETYQASSDSPGCR